MADKVLIFGKNTWPHTTAAREAYKAKGKSVEYVDVLAAKEKLENMLKHSDGVRKVPVIVEQDDVIIGFKGKTWGVWERQAAV